MTLEESRGWVGSGRWSQGQGQEKPRHLLCLLSRAGSLALECFSSDGSFLAVASPFRPLYLPISSGEPREPAAALA